jgi:N-acetylmuramoyl-L-alanine amidase
MGELMKKIMKIIFSIIICGGFILPTGVWGWEGGSGYEGGISSGSVGGAASGTAANAAINSQYKEVCFVSGEPVVFDGTLSIKKSLKTDAKTKQDVITSVYIYKLSNLGKAATLTRTLTYITNVTTEANGQKTEKTVLKSPSLETIKIGSNSYILTSYDSFTRSNLLDPKPAINYYMGNVLGTKVYRYTSTATGGVASGGTVSVSVTTGNFYGYEQYWGSTETEKVTYQIQSDIKKGNKVDSWGGIANVAWSFTSSKQIQYQVNAPDQSSFLGGYVQIQKNESILEYTSEMPEFDSKGISTDKMITNKDSLKLETPVELTNLPIPDLKHLRGNWSETDVEKLYSLGVFKGNDSTFNPDEYLTRAEFATAINDAAKAVPIDPALIPKNTKTTVKTAAQIVSPFNDVTTDNMWFNQINSVYIRDIMAGKSKNNFAPDDIVTASDAVTVFIKALGLQALAPNPAPVTAFKDNDKIPAYARASFYVADKIGLIQEDDKGYINPNAKLTKGKAASLLNKFIDYMRDGIKKDYRDGIVNF